MTGIALLLPLLAALTGEEPRPRPVISRVIIHEQVVLRVPVQPRLAPPGGWRERPGPRCLATDRLAGAVLAGPEAIDFLLSNRGRLRARLDSGCPSLDFYGGFYLQPADSQVCAGRDVIRSRIGASCRIEQFLRLEPVRRQ